MNGMSKEYNFLQGMIGTNCEIYDCDTECKTYVYLDEDLNMYLKELGTELDEDNDIMLGDYELKFEIEYRPNRFMEGNETVLVFNFTMGGMPWNYNHHVFKTIIK